MFAIRKLVARGSITLWFFFLISSVFSGQTKIGFNMPLRTIKTDFKCAYELGVRTVRVNLPWQLIEPRQGEFDWSIPDRLFETTKPKEVEVLFTVTSISPWGTKDKTRKSGIYHSSSPPKNMGQWEYFITQFASRYRNRRVCYEIGNEVNGSAF